MREVRFSQVIEKLKLNKRDYKSLMKEYEELKTERDKPLFDPDAPVPE